MFDLKKLAAEHAKLCDAQEPLIEQLAELQGKSSPSDEDTKKLEAAKTAVDENKAAMDKIEGKIGLAQELAARRVKNLEAVKVADDKSTATATIEGPDDKGGDKVPAQAKDHERIDQMKSAFFWDYMSKGDMARIPDQALDEMRPSGKGWKDAVDGIKMPAHMSKLVLGNDPIEVAKTIPDYLFAGDVLAQSKAWDGLRGKAVGDDPFLTTDANFPTVMAPPEYKAELLELPPEPTYIFSRARRVPTKTGTVRWPRLTQTDADEYGTIAGSWINEGAEKPDTEPSFEQVSIQTQEYAARTELSRTLLRRSVIDLVPFLAREFRAKILDALDVAFLTGSGTGQPTGIMNTTGIRSINRTTAGDVVYNDLVDMEHAIRAHHRPGCVWVMGDNVIQLLRKKLDNDGRPLFVANVRDGAFDTLFGKPVISTHRLTLGTDDVVYGDWSQYIVPVETDVVIFRSDHRKVENNLVIFVVFILVGGLCVQPRAFVKLGAVSS